MQVKYMCLAVFACSSHIIHSFTRIPNNYDHNDQTSERERPSFEINQVKQTGQSMNRCNIQSSKFQAVMFTQQMIVSCLDLCNRQWSGFILYKFVSWSSGLELWIRKW